MIHITEDQKAAVQQSNMRPYHTPRLRVYGAVRELTMSGSGNTKENNQGGGQPKRYP